MSRFMPSMAASSSFSLVLFAAFVFWILQVSPAESLTCTSQLFAENELYSDCLDLPVLASYLHWTYNSSNSSLSIAFIAPPAKSGGWIAWAINPTGTGMAGAQSLVAYESSGDLTVKTYSIASYGSVVLGKLSFDVWDMSAEYSGEVMRIFAKLKVPEGAKTVNHIWQVGPSVSGADLSKHDFSTANLNAKGTLNLIGGASQSVTPAGAGGADSRNKNKNIHGILNVVSWGLLFPIGVMIARYLRTFSSADPAWFYLHAFCQTSAYAVGVSGWATGLKLGSQSKGYHAIGHRNIGIALFSLATVQIFALFLRPNKDHKYRFYWNIYHHGIGYGIVVLGIINIFKGFNILNPEEKWKSAYIGVISVLAATALLLEAITWFVVLKRRRSSMSAHSHDGYNNNGESRQQPLAA